MSTVHIIERMNVKLAFRAGSVDEQVIKDTLEDDIFFKGVPEYLPRQNDIIVDVGAHIGAFSVQAGQRFPQSTVYAIEPSHDSYELLLKNIGLNNCKNIFPYKVGLSAQAGVVKLYHDIEHGNWGHSIVKQLSSEFELIVLAP